MSKIFISVRVIEVMSSGVGHMLWMRDSCHPEVTYDASIAPGRQPTISLHPPQNHTITHLIFESNLVEY